eukprot:1159411-Pelagomonas_calceolata.AAC.13
MTKNVGRIVETLSIGAQVPTPNDGHVHDKEQERIEWNVSIKAGDGPGFESLPLRGIGLPTGDTQLHQPGWAIMTGAVPTSSDTGKEKRKTGRHAETR